jgi:hypothetical protein
MGGVLHPAVQDGPDRKEDLVFALTDTPVKFVGLLVLFLLSTTWSLYQLGGRQTGPTLVSNVAHLAMSFVMLLMVPGVLWQPLAGIVGVPALVGLFAASTLWFVVLGVRGLRAGERRGRTHGWHAVGHAAMFGAMTWHLAAMLWHGGAGHDHRGSSQVLAPPVNGMTHSEHGHHGSTAPADLAQSGVDPALVIAIIGLPFMTYLLVAAIWRLKNTISPGADLLDRAGHELAGHGHYTGGNPRLGALADFAMSFGMFWMSTGLLTPLLPFLAVV